MLPGAPFSQVYGMGGLQERPARWSLEGRVTDVAPVVTPSRLGEGSGARLDGNPFFSPNPPKEGVGLAS